MTTSARAWTPTSASRCRRARSSPSSSVASTTPSTLCPLTRRRVVGAPAARLLRLRHYVLRRGSLGRLRSYATAPFFSDRPGTSYGLLRLSMYILFCIATAKPDFAVPFSGPPHTQCPATSRCGGVSVCFLCGSLCGLCVVPLLDPRPPLAALPAVGRLVSRRPPSFCLRHSFSACRPPPPLRCSRTRITHIIVCCYPLRWRWDRLLIARVYVYVAKLRGRFCSTSCVSIEHRKRPVVPTPVLDANRVGRPDIVFWERRDRRCCVRQHGSGSVYLQSLWWYLWSWSACSSNE